MQNAAVVEETAAAVSVARRALVLSFGSNYVANHKVAACRGRVKTSAVVDS